MSITHSLIERAIAWARSEEQKILRDGSKLEGPHLKAAIAVGVPFPEKVRLLLVNALPSPDDTELHAAASTAGLILTSSIGMALGNGIYIRKGHLTFRVLKHELRHVQQCQAIGGLEAFLLEYFRQCSLHSYAMTPFEIDARKAEEIDISPLKPHNH